MGEGESLRSICRDDAMPCFCRPCSAGWWAIESLAAGYPFRGDKAKLRRIMNGEGDVPLFPASRETTIA
jgi:hypothetical protein